MVRLSAAPVAGALCLVVAAGVCSARGDSTSSLCAPAAGAYAGGADAISEATTDGVWTDHVIVKLRKGVSVGQLREALKSPTVIAVLTSDQSISASPTFDPPPLNAARAAKFGLDRYFTVDVAAGSDTRALAAAIGKLSNLVELAETDPVGLFHSPPTDTLFGSQWALNNEGQTVGGVAGRPDADIDWIEAWQMPHPSAPIVIGIADTGVSYSHPDLIGQTVPGRCFVCPAGSEGNTDDNLILSHGTFCAGIAVARTDNAAGIAGTAPVTKVMPLKVANNVAASQTALGNAMRWAADHGVSIVSMSLSFGPTASVSAFRAGADYAIDAGLLLIASTGNTPRVAIGQPANWPDVLAVGATTNRDELWVGTTTGPEMDLVAPGMDIQTTVDVSSAPNTYALQTGTSMACPMVAAVVSIVWAANPALTAGDVRFLIESSVDDLGAPGRDDTFALGRLNANRALTASLATLPQCVVDYNGDGVADIGDLFTFLAIYFSQYGQTGPGLRADFDQNGVVSVDDLFTFMAAWFEGC